MRIKATNETKTEKPIRKHTRTHTHSRKHSYTDRQRQSRDECEAVAFCCIATKTLEQRVSDLGLQMKFMGSMTITAATYFI